MAKIYDFILFHNFSVFHDFSVFLKFIAEIRSYLAASEKIIGQKHFHKLYFEDLARYVATIPYI